MNIFTKESEFEQALIDILCTNGWENRILKGLTEEALIENWAQILFENNRGIDRLNDCPLTSGEMQQIMEQITELRTPLKLNGFINGKTVTVTRDHPEDQLHFGKEISLKIYDRKEIAAGQSRYQIVQQPIFKTPSKMTNNRRGDLMLLINGMPVIHIELKRTGVSVSQAYNQIEKYANEGVFSGLYSLIQVFVAMEPNETVYFANPGRDGSFNKNFYFHWADYDNEPINDFKKVASTLLSIPMAHQLIGFYTVADHSDGVLKVMRSYQYFAANAISDRVSKIDWQEKKALGGYIWHTTGSGKTMTSFKSAQLIAASKDADKVVFLMDRIELGTQSLAEYRGFANESESVQATEDTRMLITKLKSVDPSDTLIVTSIQKMSNIKTDEAGLNEQDLLTMCEKRLVFIVDEAHRSTFGDMLITIKRTFPMAIFFGFTGTPIQKENQKKMNTTATVFGNELHRYSIADGIRDHNVLGFDPYMIMTYKDKDLREKVALAKAKAATMEEVQADPAKTEVYYRYMDGSQVKMAGDEDENGTYIKGIEDELPKAQYQRREHQMMVVEDITSNWVQFSRNSKFHAIFATSSIPEAIAYYRLIKSKMPTLKITALFDPNIDNSGDVAFKEEGLIEILKDYNLRYKQDFRMESHPKFKRDIASRLAHKEPYTRIHQTPEDQLDLLIVVDQMLTGFDSKWINTLYLDKVLKYENIIQAFSRTNRLFGPDKPFGTIRYYRYPHTMEKNIKKAVKLYSGDRPYGIFVERLAENLKQMNEVAEKIDVLYQDANIPNCERLPDDPGERAQFAKCFKEFNTYLEAAEVQGYCWDQTVYEIKDDGGEIQTCIEMKMDQQKYLTLANRYKELFTPNPSSGNMPDIPFEIEGYLTEIDTGVIDTAYMESKFNKYKKLMADEKSDEALKAKTLEDLHSSFAYLPQEEQKYANIFLHDIASGNVDLNNNKGIRESVSEYQYKAKNDQTHQMAEAFGLDEEQLRALMQAHVTKDTINQFGHFDQLKNSGDKEKAKAYLEKMTGKEMSIFEVNIKTDKLLREFILEDGFDLEDLKVGEQDTETSNAEQSARRTM